MPTNNNKNEEKITKNELVVELLKLIGPIVLIVIIYYFFFA